LVAIIISPDNVRLICWDVTFMADDVH